MMDENILIENPLSNKFQHLLLEFLLGSHCGYLECFFVGFHTGVPTRYNAICMLKLLNWKLLAEDLLSYPFSITSYNMFTYLLSSRISSDSIVVVTLLDARLCNVCFNFFLYNYKWTHFLNYAITLLCYF